MPYRVRTRNRFDPASTEPFKLSRSRLESFVKCPRCFYLDRRLGVDRVGMPAFLLNSATDTLLKKEFDKHRTAQTPHPVFARYGIDAVPYQHPQLDAWRENFQGVQYLHEGTNLLVTGAVDDLWLLASGEVAVVDYKSTSTQQEITLEGPWKEAYKRQMEVYQWLLRRNALEIASVGYFLYVNADTTLDAFDDRLVFRSQVLPHEGDDCWVEDAIVRAHACLMAEEPPESGPDCDWCAYRAAAADCS